MLQNPIYNAIIFEHFFFPEKTFVYSVNKCEMAVIIVVYFNWARAVFPNRIVLSISFSSYTCKRLYAA